MTQALLLYALFLLFVVLLLTVIVGGLFFAGWLLRQKAAVSRETLQRTADSVRTEGSLTDVKLTRDESDRSFPLHYQLAVSFNGQDGQPHSVHLGVPSAEECPFANGGTVSLRVFPAAVTEPSGGTASPSASYMGRPVDDTGTVMLESDAAALQAESEEKMLRFACHSFRFFLASGIAALLALSFLLNLFLN